MLVEDVMSTDTVTCEYDSSVRTAVVQLLEQNVGSTIVVRDGEPMGIVTETDALLAGVSSRRPFHEIPIADAVSHPLITTTGDTTIRKAIERMTAEGIKKLPVVDGLELEGILTITDVATHYTDIKEEARMVAAQRERWEARKADIDEF